MLLFGEILPADPDPYPFWHSTQTRSPGLNFSLFKDKDVDTLLEEARKTLDENARREKYKEFQGKILDLKPALILYRPLYLFATAHTVGGVDPHLAAVPSGRFNNIEQWYVQTKRVWNKIHRSFNLNVIPMSDMKDVILNQHEQITHSLEVNAKVGVGAPVDVDSIILTGMGGSGHPGDLLNALALPTAPLFVHRNYDLPLAYLRGMELEKPLVVASSYSGNTEEALTGYAEARNKKLPLAVSAAGGRLQELAEADGVPFAKIDYTGMQPRHTLFAAVVGVATMLKNMGVARDMTDDFTRVAGVLQKVTPSLEEPAKKLAEKLVKKIPVFTSSDTLGFAAKNFKIQMNENTKAPAFWNTFPELNHNEMVGFSGLKLTGATGAVPRGDVAGSIRPSTSEGAHAGNERFVRAVGG